MVATVFRPEKSVQHGFTFRPKPVKHHGDSARSWTAPALWRFGIAGRAGGGNSARGLAQSKTLARGSITPSNRCTSVFAFDGEVYFKRQRYLQRFIRPNEQILHAIGGGDLFRAVGGVGFGFHLKQHRLVAGEPQ